MLKISFSIPKVNQYKQKIDTYKQNPLQALKKLHSLNNI